MDGFLAQTQVGMRSAVSAHSKVYQINSKVGEQSPKILIGVARIARLAGDEQAWKSQYEG